MIKKLSFILLFVLVPFSIYAQTTVYAYVKDQEGKPIENAEVDLLESVDDQRTDKIGYFQFVGLQPGEYHLTITRSNYETATLNFEVTEGERRKDLGEVKLSYAPIATDAGVILIDDASADDDGSSMQPTIGLLSAGRDVFQNVTAFDLGAYWFRPRGMDNRYSDVLFNGVPMSKHDNGRVEWSNWGGLNDITRYPYENVQNIAPSEYTFGNLGGVVYYNTRASSFRKGVSLAYSNTNRSYNQRVMATYNTGLLPSGWAFSVSGSRRWAEEGRIDGTYQDSYAYFAAIEKRLGEKHALNLTAFGAPTYRATNSPNTQEVYDLMGKDYNAYWGWQDGEKRNERIRKSFEPVFQLSHYWKIDEKSKLNTTLSYQQGTDRRGRLDWFNTDSPSPTYYRNLPSYKAIEGWFPTDSGEELTDTELALYNERYNFYADQWRNGTIKTQIDWNDLYQRNLTRNSNSNYYTVQDVNDDKTYTFNTHFDRELASNWKLNVNLNYQKLESDNYRRLNDLLGGNYALNYDDFDFKGNGDFGSFDVDNAENKVYEGGRMEYNYMLYRDIYAGNVSTKVTLDKWDFSASVLASYTQSEREGMFRHHLYLNDSKGKSGSYDSWDFGIKGRVEYKINGKNFIVYDGALFSIAPTLNEIFPNARATNEMTPNLKSEVINSNNLSFIHRGQTLKLRVTGYYTGIENATEISRFYAQGIAVDNGEGGQTNITGDNIFVTEILNGVNKDYIGGEFGAEIKVTPTLSVNAVASVGQFTYSNNPDVYLASDRLEGVQKLGTSYMKDYKVAGTPQQGYSLGFRYNSPKYWWFGATGNYIAGNYLDVSPILRTSNFVTVPGSNTTYPGATEALVRQLLEQRKWDNQFMLNANIGKSFLFGKYRMGVSASVNNILNNRDYVTGGFEQGRNANFDDALKDSRRPVSLFSPKLWYDRGLSFFANVYLRF